VALTTVYKCADGTDFPVTWDDPGDGEKSWRREMDHFARPYLPVEGEIFAHEFPNSFNRAFGELGLPPPAMGRARILTCNGFAYFNVPSESQAELKARFEAIDQYTDSVGNARAVWEEVALPRIRRVTERIAAMDDAADPRLIYHEMCYGWGFTQVMQVVRFALALGQFCQEQFGDQGLALSVELTQGYPNASLEADEALWQLAQMIKASDDLRRAVGTESSDMNALRADPVFWSGFQAYLDRHGGRSSQWQLHAATWRERPESVLAIAGRLAESDSPSPLQMTEAAARRREERLLELEGRLAGKPEMVESLRRLYGRASEYGPVREGKAYWQLLLFGHARQALLRIGERLVREGRIDGAGDVLFLTPDEINGNGSVDMRGVVEQEQHLWQQRLQLSPPLEIGGEGASEGAASAIPVSGEEPTLTIKGSPASRGVVTARARVIHSPEDGGRLGPGEVLVSVLTSPAWTSMFAVAGAVVTESGGMLSHPAIVAREYGIPCVVSVRDATRLIQDGELITVDGTNGEVRLPG
jgi:phosphohistidine swiveling domain-containing protein